MVASGVEAYRGRRRGDGVDARGGDRPDDLGQAREADQRPLQFALMLLVHLARQERLERRQPTRGVSLWDILCGAVRAEDVAFEEIENWSKLEPLLEEAQRLADLPDPIEARLASLSSPDSNPVPSEGAQTNGSGQ